MLYQYLAVGLQVILIVAAFVALKYTAKSIKDDHQTAIKASPDTDNNKSTDKQTSKWQLFTFLMKKYSIINVVAGIKPESMLLLFLTYSLYSLTIYFVKFWYVCFLEGIAIQTASLILEYLHKVNILSKNTGDKVTNSIEIRAFVQKSFFYYTIGILAIGGNLFMALTFYQSQQASSIKTTLLYLGISVIIDSFIIKPLLFLITLIVPQWSAILSELIPDTTKKGNQVANQFMPTNESQAKIADEFTMNIQSVFQPATNGVSDQTFQSTNLHFTLSNNHYQSGTSAEKGKKIRKKVYLESETKETTDKQNTNGKPQTISTVTNHLPFERAMKETFSNKPQKTINFNIESSTNCETVVQKIGAQSNLQKNTKRQLRKRRKEENSKFKQTNERIISIYGEEKDKKQAYETLSLKRRSFEISNYKQWSYGNRHKSTRSRENPIVHQQPSYVTPKVVHFKLSEQL